MHKPKTPARPSVPFTLPLLPPTQAGRAVTDISLFDPPAPAASAHPLRISLQSLLVSLLPRSPPPFTAGGLSGAGTDGQMEAGGRPGMRRRSLVTGIRLQTKKGDTHYIAAVLQTVPCCN